MFIWQPLLGVEAPEVDVAAPAGPLRALSGRWIGQYRCQQDIVGVTLDLVQDDDHVLDGVFRFCPLLGSPSFPEGSFAMVGEVDPNQRLFDLKSTDWIERAYGLKRHDLRGEIGDDDAFMTGRVLTTGCAEFALERHE